jgi:multidrug efflux system membrane fusion protein
VNSANDTVAVHKVTLGPSDGKNTAIQAGLSVGDTVVIDGTDRLSDGAKISIAAATSTPPATPPAGTAPGAHPRKNSAAPGQGSGPG